MKNEQDTNLKCPFCNEEDYDKPGLKYHLKYCQELERIEDIK